MDTSGSKVNRLRLCKNFPVLILHKFYYGRYNVFLLAVLPLLFLAVFYFYPLFSIFHKSFFPDGAFLFSKISKLISSLYYFRIFWFTLWQAVVSSMLALILALPCAYIFTKYNFFGKSFLRAMATIPFVMPTVVAAVALDSLLGPKGFINFLLMKLTNSSSLVLNIEHTIWIILIAHVFFNYSVVFRIMENFWSHMEQDTANAALMLGASRWQVFFKITLPLLMPAIFASGLLVFIFCFSSFGVILILGGPHFSTIEVEIYKQAVQMFNLPMAAILSIIQIIFIFCIMWIYTSFQRKSSVAISLKSEKKHLKKLKTLKSKMAVFLNTVLIIILTGIPLVSLFLRSIYDQDGFSFENYLNLFQNKTDSLFFVPPMDAILNSLTIACLTTMFALILGVFASMFLIRAKDTVSSIFDPIFMLPLSTSAVTLGFGFIICLDKPPLNLRASFFLLPIAHTLVAFPFVVRVLLPALRTISPVLKNAASMLGASPFKVWKSVELLVTLRAFLIGAIFAFTVSIGEFGATVFIARPQTPTMPLAVYRFLSQPGSENYGQAMAMSSLMMFIVVACFMILEKINTSNNGVF